MSNEKPITPADLADALRALSNAYGMPGEPMDRKRNARRRQLSGAHTAVSWNAAYPVGTAVRYWPIYPPSEGFPPEDTTTRSEAWTLGDGSVVVLVSGKTGGVHLSHVEVLP